MQLQRKLISFLLIITIFASVQFGFPKKTDAAAVLLVLLVTGVASDALGCAVNIIWGCDSNGNPNPAPPDTPAAPTGLTASCTNGTFSASWDSVYGARAYAVHATLITPTGVSSDYLIVDDLYHSTTYSRPSTPFGKYALWVYAGNVNWSDPSYKSVTCAAPPTDNGCAANTCIGQTCNNSITTVAGTKPCDNGCAANTCVGQTCNNSIAVVNGTKTITPTYTSYSCSPGNSIDCTLANKCGQENSRPGVCVAINNCTGNTENRPTSECISHLGANACNFPPTTCPSCATKPRFIEVAPS